MRQNKKRKNVIVEIWLAAKKNFKNSKKEKIYFENNKLFVSDLKHLKKLTNYDSKIDSLKRQLNLYGFKCIDSEGLDNKTIITPRENSNKYHKGLWKFNSTEKEISKIYEKRWDGCESRESKKRKKRQYDDEIMHLRKNNIELLKELNQVFYENFELLGELINKDKKSNERIINYSKSINYKLKIIKKREDKLQEREVELQKKSVELQEMKFKFEKRCIELEKREDLIKQLQNLSDSSIMNENVQTIFPMDLVITPLF